MHEDLGYSPEVKEEKGGVRRNTEGHTRTDSEAGKREIVAEAKAGKGKGTRRDRRVSGRWLCVGRLKGKDMRWNLSPRGHLRR